VPKPAARLGLGGVAAGVSLALLTWSHDALAQGKPPKVQDQSAVAQYRESIPTSSGPELTGAAAVRTAPLPAPVHAAIAREAGRSAGLLEQVATSSAYGAPQDRLPETPAGAHPGGAGAGSAITAAPGRLIASAGRSRLVGLIIVLVAVTALTAVAARRWRYPGAEPP
jgi:hypothetical protein